MENDRLKYRFWDEELQRYLNPETVAIINGKLAVFDPFKTVDGNAFFDQGHERTIIAEQCICLSASKSYRGNKPEDLLIYKGDIIKPDYGMPKCVVVWHKTGWRLMQLPIEKKCKNTDCPNEIGTLCQTYAKHFQQSDIIGNIHEEK